VLDIVFVPQPDEFHLGLQPGFQRLWEHGHPVLVPFPAANDDLSPVKIEITTSQLTALGNAHAGPVEQLDDQPMRAFLRHGGEKSPYLFLGEHGRQPLGSFRSHRIQRSQGFLQNVAVQE
jgi:hypothetical protein